MSIDEQTRKALQRIVGTARARSIDTGERVRDYHRYTLGCRPTDKDDMLQIISPLSEQQKKQLWKILQKNILEQSHWKIYELRFLMRLFGVDSITIYASSSSAPPADEQEGGDINEQQ